MLSKAFHAPLVQHPISDRWAGSCKPDCMNTSVRLGRERWKTLLLLNTCGGKGIRWILATLLFSPGKLNLTSVAIWSHGSFKQSGFSIASRYHYLLCTRPSLPFLCIFTLKLSPDSFCISSTLEFPIVCAFLCCPHSSVACIYN